MVSDSSLLEKRLELPLLKKRVQLYARIRDKKNPFSLGEWEEFIDSVAKEADSSSTYKEIEKIRMACITGELADENGRKLSPDMGTPANQLIWAASIAFLNANPDIRTMWREDLQAKRLGDTPLWDSLIKSDRPQREMGNFARHLESAMTNKDAMPRWGTPDSWFYFSPQKNIVNIDLMYTLLIGFEHSRSVALHELGHAELTTDFTPEMKRVKSEMTAIKDKVKAEKRKATKEEARDYAKLGFEWKLRHQLFNSAEDCCVNRYAIMQGKKSYQDHGPSLNTLETIIQGIGLEGTTPVGKPDGKDEKPIDGWKDNPDESSAQKRFNNVAMASNLAFFCNNGMFRNTKEEWAMLGIDIDAVNKLGKTSGKDFNYLLDMSDGRPTGERPHSVGWLQPELYLTRIEKAKGKDLYKNVLQQSLSIFHLRYYICLA